MSVHRAPLHGYTDHGHSAVSFSMSWTIAKSCATASQWPTGHPAYEAHHARHRVPLPPHADPPSSSVEVHGGWDGRTVRDRCWCGMVPPFPVSCIGYPIVDQIVDIFLESPPIPRALGTTRGPLPTRPPTAASPSRSISLHPSGRDPPIVCDWEILRPAQNPPLPSLRPRLRYPAIPDFCQTGSSSPPPRPPASPFLPGSFRRPMP